MGKFKFKKAVLIKEEESAEGEEQKGQGGEQQNAASGDVMPQEIQALLKQKLNVQNAISELQKQIQQKETMITQLEAQAAEKGFKI